MLKTIVPTLKQALEIKSELIWKEMEGMTVERAISEWLRTISNNCTRKSYEIAMKELCRNSLIFRDMTLHGFSMRNHDATVDKIKTEAISSQIKRKDGVYFRLWSEATRQQRAAAFVSFTGFLSRRTGGLIRKATPNKEGQSRTFYRINQHVKTKAFQNRKEWSLFLRELHKINPRDCLIAKIMLQGGKRISEALSIKVGDIDFKKGEITFKQSKTKGVAQVTVISYRQEIMNELESFIASRSGNVFVTCYGKPIAPQQIERNFKKAGERAGIPFKVTPHVLRATAITYFKSEGLSDSDIMKVTGHLDSEMIRMYDKSSLSDNASKKINLV